MIDLFHQEQYFKIHFDETGTFIWNHIDGTNSVRDLGKLLKNKSKENPLPQAEERVEKFIVMLLKNKFVKAGGEKKGPEWPAPLIIYLPLSADMDSFSDFL